MKWIAISQKIRSEAGFSEYLDACHKMVKHARGDRFGNRVPISVGLVEPPSGRTARQILIFDIV